MFYIMNNLAPSGRQDDGAPKIPGCYPGLLYVALSGLFSAFAINRENKKMRHKFLSILALGFLFFAGCEEYEYTIEMRFEDGRVVRRVICSENMPDEIRVKLKEMYEKQIDKHTFEGSFSQKLPEDVGGFGRCSHLRNPMGEVYIYHERFRGKDDQAKDLQKSYASVDQILDLLIEWLEMELGDHPNFDKLKTFCVTQLRTDLKNICTYLWLGSRTMKDDSSETAFRVLQYLYEREYFTLDDVARLAIAPDDERVYFAFTRLFIARKMGFESEEAIAKELSFLTNEENILKSVERFVKSSETIQRIVKSHCEKENQEAPTEPEEIMGIVMQHYAVELDIFFIDIFPANDQVNVALTLSHAPYETNGQWDEEKKQVTWSRKIRREKVVDIPFLCYAAYTEPDRKYQKVVFGDTILGNEDLTIYSFWYKGLTSKQQQEWDRCLTKLEAKSDLVEKLKAFRFSDIPEPYQNSQGESMYPTDTVVELIQSGLKPQQD
jgi:hypothetical protein